MASGSCCPRLEAVAAILARARGPFPAPFQALPVGCVITASKVELQGDRLAMEVDYTTSRPVPGLSGLRPLPGGAGKWIAEQIWNLRVLVGAVWKLLPWNKGLAPTCAVKLVYHDGDMRIVEEDGGSLFVYMRPVAPRPIDGPQFK